VLDSRNLFRAGKIGLVRFLTEPPTLSPRLTFAPTLRLRAKPLTIPCSRIGIKQHPAPQALTLSNTLLGIHKNPLVKERIEEELYERMERKHRRQRKKRDEREEDI